MISNEAIEQQFKSIDNVAHVSVTGDGYHYQLVVVSDLFEGLSKVKRQQWVYAQLKNVITSGSLHALTMTTLTQGEWESQDG